MNEEIRKYMSALGKKGGKRAAANMTPEQRKQRALKAVQKREEKRKLKNDIISS